MSTDLDIVSTYSEPQVGGELPYFVGKQYGGGWLQLIGRLAFPLLKKIGNVFGKTAKNVVIDRKPFGQSLKSNALDELETVVPDAKKYFNGKGLKRKRSINKLKSKGTIFQ